MEALANERTGLFQRHLGDKAKAETFYEAARTFYGSWGANAKVDRLVYHY